MVSQKEKTEAEQGELTLEKLFADLPIPDESKQALSNLFTNLVTTIAESNQRIAGLEARAAEENPKMYEGMTPDQVFQIQMAKAQAPAAAAQQQMWAAVLGRGGGGGDQGGMAGLVKSAEALNSLRDYLLPPPTAQQIALESAQIDQIKAQTRLMDRVTGKKVEDFAAGKEE
ncbi:unnamed protein product [marine sediment metagenome]|uniref:Uncharacterized protein n=1 Tax=marine sediment metagenome TaxID=412755 RepID=X1RSY7_9ZZZZ